MDTSPRLLTDSYHIQFVFNFDGIDYTKLNVGERLTPGIISIDLIDKNDVNNFLLWTIARSDDVSQPITYVPPELFDDGHAFLSRESEDVWILDVDAWFNAEAFVCQDVWITYYFRASFKIVLEFRPII